MSRSGIKAFSSDVDSGSRQENAPNRKSGAPFRWHRNGRGAGRIVLTGAMLAIVSVASGCSSIDRLSQIGEQPKLNAIENPTAQPGYKPVQMPMPKPETVSYNANSLWRNGSSAFFKDQRAARIGDILTVTVNITDKANIANETQRSRTTKEDSGITDFAGNTAADRKRREGVAGPDARRQTRPHRPTARARSTARKPCRPTSPPWSRSYCRTAISWSKASRRSASISKFAN